MALLSWRYTTLPCCPIQRRPQKHTHTCTLLLKLSKEDARDCLARSRRLKDFSFPFSSSFIASPAAPSSCKTSEGHQQQLVNKTGYGTTLPHWHGWTVWTSAIDAVTRAKAANSLPIIQYLCTYMSGKMYKIVQLTRHMYCIIASSLVYV